MSITDMDNSETSRVRPPA